MTPKTKAFLAVLCANVFFGVNFVVVKLVAPIAISSYALNLLRVLTASALFWLLFVVKPSKIGIQKKHLPRFIVCGASGVALNQILFLKGLTLTSSIHAVLLMLVTPILITFIAAWVLKEKINALKLFGLALGISGAVLLILSKDYSNTAPNKTLGDVLIILNAISYAFYLVWVRPLMEVYSPIHVVRWVFVFGTLMILPIGWYDMAHTNFEALTHFQWMALAFICIGATFLAYLFNIYSVAILGASITGSFIYTQPIFASVTAMIFLGEKFSKEKLIAALLIFAGVYLVSYKRKITTT